jgi:hypothetical protein
MPRPPEPGTGPEREEERQRKLAALRARLREDARSLRTPDDWARCLRLAALMPGEDFANILLVSGQRPAAVMVADYRQWTAMGRQVRRGEKAPGRRAHRFAASWAPAYLEGRDISAAVAAEWDIGYAPAGWTTLTDHLRSLGHGDDEIEAAGLAKPSTRGTFIDRFRDRVMLPVHDERGRLAGFIGRANPGAGPDVPKYLNSPRPPDSGKAACCSGCTAPARPSPRAPSPSPRKDRSTPSPSTSPTPAGTPGSPPAAPP